MEPTLKTQARDIARDLGLWVLELARSHACLADVIGWATLEASRAKLEGRHARRRALTSYCAWLSKLDARTYPEQLAELLGDIDGPWAGRHGPRPWLKQRDHRRQARPLPVCESCSGRGHAT